MHTKIKEPFQMPVLKILQNHNYYVKNFYNYFFICVWHKISINNEAQILLHRCVSLCKETLFSNYFTP